MIEEHYIQLNNWQLHFKERMDFVEDQQDKALDQRMLIRKILLNQQC